MSAVLIDPIIGSNTGWTEDDTMTDTATSREQDASPAEVQLTVRDDATETERRNAERSVAAMVARSSEAAARRRAAEAELAQISDALREPFGTAPAPDDRADTALAKLRARDLIYHEEMEVLSHHSSVAFDPTPLSRDVLTTRSQGFVPPYDFQWAWHDPAGHPAFNIVQARPSGRLGLDARSGSAPGGASGLVNVHAGFGVFLSSSVQAQKFPHAVLNPGNYRWAVRAIGVGSNATSEGGFEITVFEDGQFLTGASRKLWRGRVSGSVFSPDESASDARGNHLITGPDLQFTIRPGHGYTFNAGIWVYSDRSTGVGAGAVQSLLQGTLTRMWVFG